ncbi:MAG: hypothetical protein HOO67_03885 [Candidatus Peribacteraceae bacterium]|nr:hypothetical protein [Candidatus Peribacteraceae bacterium]
MPTATKKTAAQTAQKATLPPTVRMQQEMMIMRETDQWMTEHYNSRPISR